MYLIMNSNTLFNKEITELQYFVEVWEFILINSLVTYEMYRLLTQCE